jgi:hypothetical protein
MSHSVSWLQLLECYIFLFCFLIFSIIITNYYFLVSSEVVNVWDLASSELGKSS